MIKGDIYVTADTHGEEDLGKVQMFDFNTRQLRITKKDYLVILGDFGVIWYPEKHRMYKYRMKVLEYLHRCPWTTLFIDGNHENFDMLNKYPVIDMFDGKVGKINDSVFHLKRGEVYNICGKKIYCMGGATSIDKNLQSMRNTWWEEELPSPEELKHGMLKLREHNFEVDYIFTHNGPKSITQQYTDNLYKRGLEIKGSLVPIKLTPKDLKSLDVDDEDEFSCSLSEYFDDMMDLVTYKKWYFGHWHDDWLSDDGKHQMLFEGIIRLNK